ncbi:LexA family protein [Fulvitalea axinellae]
MFRTEWGLVVLMDLSKNIVVMAGPLALYVPENAGLGGVPLVMFPVTAGFPSPAEDYLEGVIDLNRELVGNREATFFARVRGESMSGANIHDGDVLVVDRSMRPREGDLAVCCVNGEFTLKRFSRRGGKVRLLAANPEFPDIEVGAGDDFMVWGVVTYTIQRRK